MNQIICYSDLLLLSKDPVQNVESLIELGADCVELMMDGPWWNEMEHVFDELASKLSIGCSVYNSSTCLGY
jgi:aryl carrier-like protein